MEGCPKCGFQMPDGAIECPACGIVLAKYRPARSVAPRPRPQPQVPTVPSQPPLVPSWYRSWQSLRTWFRIYLATWLGGAVVAIGGGIVASGSEGRRELMILVGVGLFLSSIVPYVGSMYFAYKVQGSLRVAGEIKSGAWQVLVAGLLLNPYLLGFYVPLSVSFAAKTAMLRIRRGRGA